MPRVWDYFFKFYFPFNSYITLGLPLIKVRLRDLKWNHFYHYYLFPLFLSYSRLSIFLAVWYRFNLRCNRVFSCLWESCLSESINTSLKSLRDCISLQSLEWRIYGVLFYEWAMCLTGLWLLVCYVQDPFTLQLQLFASLFVYQLRANISEILLPSASFIFLFVSAIYLSL